MLRYGAVRVPALALFVSMALFAQAGTVSAADIPCRQAVERAWSEAGIEPGQVTEVMVASRRHAKEGNMGGDMEVVTTTPSCSGKLVVHVTDMCFVRQVYTRGDCELPGVPAFR